MYVKNLTTVTSELATVEEFSLDEVTGDTFLFSVFVQEMEKKHRHENLLCWKEIALFKLRYDESRPKENSSRAWYIYRKFLVPCVELEVSCHSEARNKIMFSLADPKCTTFDSVQKNCFSSIKNEDWKVFKGTEAYKKLGHILRQSAQELAASGQGSDKIQSSQTCIVQ